MPEESDTTDTIQKTTEVLNDSASDLAKGLTHWFKSQSWVSDYLAQTLAVVTLLIILLAFAWLIYVLFRPIILRFVKHAVTKSAFTWDDQLLGHGVFRWLTHLLPGAIIYLLAPGLFESIPWLANTLQTAAGIYLLLSGYFVIDSLTNAVQSIVGATTIGKQFNIIAFGQVIKLIAALVILLLCISVLLQKPPLALLGGIGVMASVFMLVFKDVILGFVAGIQLSSNQMLSKGDWLEMPSQNADGSVEQIGLTTVKVRNWDMTITTIPTYALISQSFRNWRGMSEGGGRRIKRSLRIDTNSIRLCDDEMLDRFRKIENIAEYIEKKEKEIAEFNKKFGAVDEAYEVNARRLTNVGTFRAYIEAYLRHHPDINQEMTLLVRQLEPEGRGLPIQIYCFSANKKWAAYEGIQADIFDHLLAVIHDFDLCLFQEPTGHDFRHLREQAHSRG